MSTNRIAIARSDQAGMARATLRRYGYPLLALVRRDVRKRYAATMLGVGWTLLQPLVLVAIYVTVFVVILPSGRGPAGARDAVFVMLAGMLPYLALADGIQRACASLREDRTLLDRADFPAAIVPAARVLSASVAEVVGLGVLIVLGTAFGRPITPWLVLLPILVALRVAITCGVAWIVSTLSMFVADLAEGLSLLLTAWLFLTPIFYPADAVPAGLRWLLVINPLHPIVSAYRAVLVGHSPVPEIWIAGVWAAALGIVSWWFFHKTIDRGKDLL